MEYSINQLSKLAGVSKRTLRYYDEIGLLKPTRLNASKYRIYGQPEVDRLQQILFYRALGFGLDEIQFIVSAKDFDRERALYDHLEALTQKKEQLELLISNVQKTIRSMKGELIMQDREKFEGFKQKMMDENEANYGEEVRKRYGKDTVNASNAKFKNMTQEQYAEMERLSAEVNQTLKEAMASGDPKGQLAQKACDLHRRWLCFFWEKGMYSKETHTNLVQMYCDDERFRDFYVKNVGEGAAEFLREAMDSYQPLTD